MQIEPTLLERLISELASIRQSAYWLEGEFESELSKVDERALKSARNLLHYVALRRRDLRPLQEELSCLGLSSLGHAEPHVLGTIDRLLEILHRLRGRDYEPAEAVRAIGYDEGRFQLAARTDELFGRVTPHDSGERASVRVMVTMPDTAAVDYELVRDLVANGMSCMRINCAHEDTNAWAAMIENLERARREVGRHCALFMDLAGPKVRTGPVEPGPRVVRWEPKRSLMGDVVAPALLWLTPVDTPEAAPPNTKATIPLDADILSRLEPGDHLSFRDLRGRHRELRIRRASGKSWLAECDQITYLGSDTVLSPRVKNGDGTRELPGMFSADGIAPREQGLWLRAGDTLFVSKSPLVASPVVRDVEGVLREEPSISCSIPSVLDGVRVGHRALFDDGKLAGTVTDVLEEGVRVRLTHPIGKSKKLRALKGINLPDSHMGLSALTRKDCADLDFVIRHADIVGVSFVNTVEDIEAIQREIDRRTSRDVGLVLKIETQRACEELPRLLLAALRRNRAGVMIARGDLAVEVGFERLAELQEEILWICEAAHVPVIWATQVLERLSKKGMPTRAEITDAAMSERAECVMLNKGPHVVETVRVLSDVLRRMQEHHDKNRPTLRPLRISRLGHGRGP